MVVVVVRGKRGQLGPAARRGDGVGRCHTAQNTAAIRTVLPTTLSSTLVFKGLAGRACVPPITVWVRVRVPDQVANSTVHKVSIYTLQARWR